MSAAGELPSGPQTLRRREIAAFIDTAEDLELRYFFHYVRTMRYFFIIFINQFHTILDARDIYNGLRWQAMLTSKHPIRCLLL